LHAHIQKVHTERKSREQKNPCDEEKNNKKNYGIKMAHRAPSQASAGTIKMSCKDTSLIQCDRKL
jgi:hypothetical protein